MPLKLTLSVLLSRGEVPREEDRGASRIFNNNPYTKRYRYIDPVWLGGLNFCFTQEVPLLEQHTYIYTLHLKTVAKQDWNKKKKQKWFTCLPWGRTRRRLGDRSLKLVKVLMALMLDEGYSTNMPHCSRNYVLKKSNISESIARAEGLKYAFQVLRSLIIHSFKSFSFFPSSTRMVIRLRDNPN